MLFILVRRMKVLDGIKHTNIATTIRLIFVFLKNGTLLVMSVAYNKQLKVMCFPVTPFLTPYNELHHKRIKVV